MEKEIYYKLVKTGLTYIQNRYNIEHKCVNCVDFIEKKPI